MVHLISNERVTARKVIAVKDDESLPDDAAMSLLLRYQWIVWEAVDGVWQQEHPVQRVNDTNCFMDNMEDFWQTCVRLPQPSEFLSNRMALNVADRFRTIDARVVFREGITPRCEDEANAQGGHLQVVIEFVYFVRTLS